MGPDDVEFVDAMAPKEQYIETPGFNENYGETLARDIEQGDYLEKLPMDPAEIKDRLRV